MSKNCGSFRQNRMDPRVTDHNSHRAADRGEIEVRHLLSAADSPELRPIAGEGQRLCWYSARTGRVGSWRSIPLKRLTRSEKLQIDLGKFFQTFRVYLISPDCFLNGPLLIRRLEPDFVDLARPQVRGEVIKRPMFGALGAGTVGFTAGRESLPKGRPQQRGRNR